MREDRNCIDDIGLRDALVQLLLSFNTVWLRPALEALFGLEIARVHAADSVNIFKFLCHHLMRNELIAAKYQVTTENRSSNP